MEDFDSHDNLSMSLYLLESNKCNAISPALMSMTSYLLFVVLYISVTYIRSTL